MGKRNNTIQQFNIPIAIGTPIHRFNIPITIGTPILRFTENLQHAHI